MRHAEGPLRVEHGPCVVGLRVAAPAPGRTKPVVAHTTTADYVPAIPVRGRAVARRSYCLPPANPVAIQRRPIRCWNDQVWRSSRRNDMGKADKAESSGHKAEQTPPLKVESQGRGALAAAFSVRTARVTARQSYCRRVLPDPRALGPEVCPTSTGLPTIFLVRRKLLKARQTGLSSTGYRMDTGPDGHVRSQARTRDGSPYDHVTCPGSAARHARLRVPGTARRPA